VVTTLVGRDRPVARLRAELDRTVASHGGVVLVTGEAGIGKSALVRDLVGTARDSGAGVAVGTCWDRDDAPGHWPWVQVVRALIDGAAGWADARAQAGAELDAWLTPGGGDLGGLVGDEFALHDSVTTLLVALARRRPAVVVLEDLHWADEASLRLLDFVARHAWYERLLIVGTYRDVEVDAPGHPLGPAMADLAARATTITLTGLAREEVARLAADLGAAPTDEEVDELHRRTGGNPFFVEQTLRLWAGQGAAATIPPGVRDAVARRLAQLPAPSVAAVRTLALLGHRVDRAVLAAATGTDDGALAEVLGPAATARLVDADGDGWSFVHDLVRETLLDDLDAADARRRHAVLLDRLSAPALDGRVTPGDRAHHAHAAGEEVEAERRIGALVAASRDAASRMALDEATGHLRRALDSTSAPDARVFTLVELGWLELRAGDLASARSRFREASALALVLDDDGLLTRACLSLRATVWLVPDPADPAAVDSLIEQAHDRLVVDRGRPSTAVTAWDRERELTDAALEMCRRSGDDRALWDALNARHDSIWAPGTAVERLALDDELVALARRHRDVGREVEARQLRLGDLVETGDPAAHDEHAALQALVLGLDSAWNRALGRWSAATMDVLAGRFDEARSRIDEVMGIDRDALVGHADVAVMVLQVRWEIELLQGRDEAVEALLAEAAAVHPYPDLLRALTAVERGEADRADRLVRSLMKEPVAGDRWFAPLWLRLRAGAAALLGDRDAAAAVAADLAPLRGHWVLPAQGVVGGPYSLWAAVTGAVAAPGPEAVADLLGAAAEADRLGARVWSVRARLAAARAGAAHRATAETSHGDPTAAFGGVDLGELSTEARELGLARAVAAIAALVNTPDPDRRAAPASGGSPGPTPSPDGPEGDPDAIEHPGGSDDAAPVLRREGDVWELRYGGTTAHLPDAKGLRDLHTLIGRPGMGVRAVDLLDPEAGAVGRAARTFGGDAVLDERAKAAYRTRLDQLDGAIDAAVARGQDDRAADLDRERAALIEELRRATGLGGRARRLGDDAERARKAVRERVRDTIRRIRRVHPELAAHLDATVHTGATCRYEPDPPTGGRR